MAREVLTGLLSFLCLPQGGVFKGLWFCFEDNPIPPDLSDRPEHNVYLYHNKTRSLSLMVWSDTVNIVI